MGDAILDGEVIAADETGRPQFYDLLRDMRAPAYVAFDVIWLNGVDLRALPLPERRRHLQNILPKGSAIISEALSVTGRGHKLFELMCAAPGAQASAGDDYHCHSLACSSGDRNRWMESMVGTVSPALCSLSKAQDPPALVRVESVGS